MKHSIASLNSDMAAIIGVDEGLFSAPYPSRRRALGSLLAGRNVLFGAAAVGMVVMVSWFPISREAKETTGRPVSSRFDHRAADGASVDAKSLSSSAARSLGTQSAPQSDQFTMAVPTIAYAGAKSGARRQGVESEVATALVGPAAGRRVEFVSTPAAFPPGNGGRRRLPPEPTLSIASTARDAEAGEVQQRQLALAESSPADVGLPMRSSTAYSGTAEAPGPGTKVRATKRERRDGLAAIRELRWK